MCQIKLCTMAQSVFEQGCFLPGVVLPNEEDTDTSDSLGVTELMVNAFRGNADRVHKLLLEDPSRLHVKNHQGATTLDYAVSNKQLKVVDTLLGHDADLNALDADGYNILHRCVLCGQLDKVKFCVEMGADIDYRSRNNATALILATKTGHMNIVTYLIHVVCDITARDHEGFSALEYAFFSDNIELQKIVQQASEVKEVPCCESYALLITAIANGVVDGIETIVTQLNEEELNLAHPVHGYFTALHIACRRGHQVAAQLLIQHGANIHKRTANGNTALIMAAKSGHSHIVELLIDNGALLNYSSTNDCTALLCAISQNHMNVIKKLIERKALLNINSLCRADQVETIIGCNLWVNPLVMAIYNGAADVVAYLLEHGAYAEKANRGYGTALALAASNGHFECVKCLLQGNANINRQQEHGNTVLMLASGHGHLSIVKHLVENGADMNIINNNGLTALDIARTENQVEVLNFLMGAVSKPAYVQSTNNYSGTSLADIQYMQENLLTLCEKGCDSKTVFMHLINNRNLNTLNNEGRTPLMTAVIYKHQNCVLWLLQSGADVNLQNQSGMTALMLAAELGCSDITKMLLDFGADSYLKDFHGRDVLNIVKAAQNKQLLDLLDSYSKMKHVEATKDLLTAVWKLDYEKCTELLLKDKIDLNGADCNWNTALSFCITDKSPRANQIAQLLCHHGIDVEVTDSKGRTPLQQCVLCGNTDVVPILLKHGAPTNTTISSALFDACLYSNMDIIKIIMKYIKDVNLKERTRYFEKALQFAAMNNQRGPTVYFLQEIIDLQKTWNPHRFLTTLELIPEICNELFNALRGQNYLQIGEILRSVPAWTKTCVTTFISDNIKNLKSSETEILLWIALESGYYEIAAILSECESVMIDRDTSSPSKIVGFDRKLESDLTMTLEALDTLWKDMLGLQCFSVMQACMRDPDVVGVAKNQEKTKIYIHSLQAQLSNAYQCVTQTMKSFPCRELLTTEIVQQKSTPRKPLGFKCCQKNHPDHQHRHSFQISITYPNAKTDCNHDIYNESVGYFYKDISGCLWAVTACSNFYGSNTGCLNSSHVKRRCRVSLLTPTCKRIQFENCLCYLGINLSSPVSVNIAAVCLNCSVGMDTALLNPCIFTGQNEALLGRTVIVSGYGSAQPKGCIIDVNVSFRDHHGNAYHSVFVVSSVDDTKPFVAGGDYGRAVIDQESGIVFGLVVAMQENYYFPSDKKLYKNICYCVKLQHGLKFLFEKWNVQLGRFCTL